MVSTNAHIAALKGPILVTGAAGFVGANLFQMVAAVRHDVYAVVRRDKGWRLADVKDEQIIVADLNDPTETKHLIDVVAPQTIFDCVAYGAYSFEEDPSLIHETNYQSVVSLVGQLATRSISAFVHAGSSSEYGDNCSAPSEDAECRPNSHYAVSKLAVTGFLSFMGKYHRFPCVSLRLYSVYGPLEDTSRLIPNLLRQALLAKLPPFVDARTSRDFIHVDDVCEAFILAATKMNPGLYGEALNIGSGIKTTIGELATTARRLFGVVGEPVFGSMEGRKWDLPDWYADNRKAVAMLEWRPKVSLDAGLKSTANWIGQLSEEEFSFTSKRVHAPRKRSVSAIIACYKDAQAIPVMYQRLTATFRKLGVDYEIIFVNDGSPDDSALVIQEISKTDSHVVGVTHSRNFGSQMAFRSGMELSTKDSVVLLDGDLQDPPELIEAFYGKWDQGWDVVYGRRVRRDMPWYWGMMYKLFYRIFALFSYIRIPLDAGDFSLIDRRVVGWLLKCPERDLFMRGLRAYVGFRQTGVDYVRPDRMFGRTTNSLIKNIDWAKKGIFSFSNAPLTMLTTVGIVAFALSTGIAVLSILLRVFVPDIAPRGVTTLLVVTLMFGSFNLFAIGLVGEYVAKIMAEVKGRPRLIRTEIIRNGEVRALLPDGK
jgi:dolichol-phosphate mannosyltransferase